MRPTLRMELCLFFAFPHSLLLTHAGVSIRQFWYEIVFRVGIKNAKNSTRANILIQCIRSPPPPSRGLVPTALALLRLQGACEGSTITSSKQQQHTTYSRRFMRNEAIGGAAQQD